MTSERLKIFNLSQLPASPPRFGAQARLHGLMSELGRRHDLTAMVLLDDEFDADECRKAMLEYCKEVILVPNTLGRGGTGKRLLQLGSLASFKSFERLRLTVPALQHAVDAVLRKQRFDIVNLEFSFLGYCNLRQAPQGEKAPPVIVDSHNIDYDLARQYAKTGGSALRRFYAGVNWRKLRREELRTYREADGVTLCSVADQQRLLSEAPGVKTVVIPNAANVDYFQPRQSNAPAGEQTIVFFGLMSYQPNIDAIQYFVANIWPRIAAANPGVRFKIIGGKPPKSLLALAGPAIEFTGLVDD